MSRFLPDVNVLIALSLPEHVHSQAANKWHLSVGRPALRVCRITQLGFLRLLTNEHVVGSAVLSNDDAAAFYQRLIDDRFVEFAHEPNHLDMLLVQHARSNQPSPNLWTDAYLSSFCASLDLHLVTFDAALARRTPHSVLLHA